MTTDAKKQLADAIRAQGIKVYRAGGAKGLTADKGGPTFYSTAKAGAKPYMAGDESNIRESTISPSNVFDTQIKTHRALYNQFQKDTDSPAGYGRTGRPFWTAEPYLRKWLVDNNHNFDAIMFDENTGHPSYAVYK